MSISSLFPRYWFRAIAVALAALLPAAWPDEVPADQRPARPNIVYIMTDQQHAGMLSCTGNPYLKTPSLDRLANSGCRFELAYCANPVCLPSRVAMMTGRYPSRFGIGFNDDGRNGIPQKALGTALGWLFREAGYRTVYGGKTHWPRGMTCATIGFDVLDRDQRERLADSCARFLKQKHRKPFLLIASFINPHDICYMAIDERTRVLHLPPHSPKNVTERKRLAEALAIPAGVSREEFLKELCPPLPPNHEIAAPEPTRIGTYLENFPHHKFARENWSPERWRHHRWAYCRLTEMVDAQIGRVLAALREAGLERNTVVLFSSDHGELAGAHRLEQKMLPYEEAARVPFLVSYPGVVPAGRVDRTHLVSAGVDLLPTLCDFAGIASPAGLPGRSVRPLAEGRVVDDWRDQLVIETGFSRTLRTARYKYTVYERGDHREQLVDLERDPGEMVNLAEDPAYASLLDDHRERLARWVEQTDDRIAARYLVKHPKP